MKEYIFIITLLLFCQSSFSFDRDEVDELVNNYQASLEKYYKNATDNDSKYEVSLSFKDAYESLHESDINLVDNNYTTVLTYLQNLADHYHSKAIVHIYNTYIFDCLYYSKTYSQGAAVVTFEKEVVFGNKRVSTKYLLLISTNGKYKIIAAYLKTLHPENLPSCSMPKEEKNALEELKKFEASYMKKAGELQVIGDYIGAKRLYNEVLKLNPQNTVAKDRISDCNTFITSENLTAEIDKLITDNEYSLALIRLRNLRDSAYPYDAEWFLTQYSHCELALSKQRALETIANADYYYAKKMYKAAKTIYNRALKYNYKKKYVLAQINLCIKGDPSYIKGRIQEAYYNALASKKNYLTTFKIYQEYEKSGYLKGENYYFMCIVMLGDKRVKKGMGYSNSLTQKLAKKYFYKAKRLGCSSCDLSFVESQVFTRSINKKH